MTGKLNRLFRSTGWFALCLVTSAVISFADSTNRSPVIFPNGEGTNASAYHLVWPTDPGVRYQPQQSPDLLGWTTLSGYPKLGPGLADQLPVQRQQQPPVLPSASA